MNTSDEQLTVEVIDDTKDSALMMTLMESEEIDDKTIEDI